MLPEGGGPPEEDSLVDDAPRPPPAQRRTSLSLISCPYSFSFCREEKRAKLLAWESESSRSK